MCRSAISSSSGEAQGAQERQHMAISLACDVHVKQIIPHVVVLLDVLFEALSHTLLHVVRIEAVLWVVADEAEILA